MSAKYLHYSYEQLKTFCMDAFQEFGFNSEGGADHYRRAAAVGPVRN